MDDNDDEVYVSAFSSCISNGVVKYIVVEREKKK